MATAEVSRRVSYMPSKPGGKGRSVDAEDIAAVEKITKIGHEKEGHTAIRLKDGSVRYTRDTPDEILEAVRSALRPVPVKTELVDAVDADTEVSKEPPELELFEEVLAEETCTDPAVYAARTSIRQGSDYHRTVLELVKQLVKRSCTLERALTRQRSLNEKAADAIESRREERNVIYRVMVRTTNSEQPDNTFWQYEVLYCGPNLEDARMEYLRSEPKDFGGYGNPARETIIEQHESEPEEIDCTEGETVVM